MKIYLASKSPRRRDLLQQIGIDFEVIDVDVDETWDSIATHDTRVISAVPPTKKGYLSVALF